MKDKDLFKALCYADDVEPLLAGLVPQKREHIRDNWHYITPTCRYCKKEVAEKDFAAAISYWKGMHFPAHKDCVKEGSTNEAYECQIIDGDCNDCIDFDRERWLSKQICEGTCARTGKKVLAYPLFCSAHECFTHRLDKPSSKS